MKKFFVLLVGALALVAILFGYKWLGVEKQMAAKTSPADVQDNSGFTDVKDETPEENKGDYGFGH